MFLKIYLLFFMFTCILSKNISECDICTDITNIIEDEIKISNTSITYIEDIIKILCYLLINSEKFYCN